MGIRVDSCFDGCGINYQALKNQGIAVDRYYASEIDPFAIKISKKNHLDIIQLGDITKQDILPRNIDLMVAGSPCQGFSFSGKKLAFRDSRSRLFFTWADRLKKIKPKYFLFENVKMKKEHQNVISEYLGVEPIEINSGIHAPAVRKRLYWTNIPIGNIEKKDICLQDILEDGFTDREKSHCLDANYWKGGNLKSYFEKHRRQLCFSSDGLCHVGEADLKGIESLKRVYHPSGKAPTLTTMGGGHREPKIAIDNLTWRKLTPLECERCMMLPDGYTKGVSNTQRYKMLGNGFNCFTIEQLLKGIK